MYAYTVLRDRHIEIAYIYRYRMGVFDIFIQSIVVEARELVTQI